MWCFLPPSVFSFLLYFFSLIIPVFFLPVTLLSFLTCFFSIIVRVFFLPVTLFTIYFFIKDSISLLSNFFLSSYIGSLSLYFSEFSFFNTFYLFYSNCVLVLFIIIFFLIYNNLFSFFIIIFFLIYNNLFSCLQ